MSISLPNARGSFLPLIPSGIQDPIVKKYLEDMKKELELFFAKQFDNTYRVSQDIKYVYFVIPSEGLAVATNVLGRIYVEVTGKISKVDASVITAPTGASIICDINKNGTTIWSTTANRITIAASAYTGTQNLFNTTEVFAGDYFTIDVDQVGSTVPGAKLTVRLALQP